MYVLSIAGCLALAELGRRGLLLPERLQDGERTQLCVCVWMGG